MRGWAIAVALAGCDASITEMDNIYSHGADHAILCGLTVDNKTSVSADAIASGLDRAQVDGTLLHLYTHRPQGTVDIDTIESVLASAADRNLPFVTYAQLVDDPQLAGPGLVFSFDDHDVAGWWPLREMFDRYGAKVTFFISAFDILTDEEKQHLHELEADGHAIEYHSTFHFNAQQYADANGVDAYITDDILPDLQMMRAAGFDPKAFAYPFGARTPATDAAVLQYFSVVRAIHFTCPR